jgi:DNA-directed RNA polymerase specialized sigma24 family protein
MQGSDSVQGDSVSQWRAHVASAYERHGAAISAALTRTFGAAHADDAVQEMFMRALMWTPSDRWRERVMSFKFMTRCTARVALRHFRTESRRARHERGRAVANRPECPWSCTPARAAERRERCDMATTALGDLPSWQRPAMQMMMVDRRTCRDVARITGVRATTLNNWRHRFAVDARHRLDAWD